MEGERESDGRERGEILKTQRMIEIEIRRMKRVERNRRHKNRQTDREKEKEDKHTA